MDTDMSVYSIVLEFAFFYSSFYKHVVKGWETKCKMYVVTVFQMILLNSHSFGWNIDTTDIFMHIDLES